jgi:hypothetical protein
LDKQTLISIMAAIIYAGRAPLDGSGGVAEGAALEALDLYDTIMVVLGSATPKEKK